MGEGDGLGLGVPDGVGDGVLEAFGVSVDAGVPAGFGGVASGEGEAGAVVGVGDDVDSATGVTAGGVSGCWSCPAAGDGAGGTVAAPSAVEGVGVPGVGVAAAAAASRGAGVRDSAGAARSDSTSGSPTEPGAPSPALGSRLATAFTANRPIPSNVSTGE